MKWIAYIIWFVVWIVAWGWLGPVLEFGTGNAIIHGLGFMVWIVVLWFGFKLINSAFPKTPEVAK